MTLIHQRISRRRFIQLALGTAVCLTAPAIRGASPSNLSPTAATVTLRGYGAGLYGRGAYGARSVYLPIVAR
ncbi:MAG: twin-arginine translocation signal domain-containing protein [Chloroflexi bacterium]|nr:twin-arginine translocation signal domain-containing protein [Chloroflexota bacterium]